MMTLLVFKERLKKIYNAYDMYITPAIKFVCTLVALIVISMNAGYMPLLKNPAVIIVISLICMFLPKGIIAVILSLVIVGHLYSLSVEMAAIALLLMIIMYLLFFRYTPKDSLILIMLPVLFFLKIPYIIPIIIGLIGTPISIISVVFGTMLYYMLSYVKDNLAAINGMSSSQAMEKVNVILNAVLKNKALMITILAFALTIVVVYIIRRMSIDYSWSIAIVAGGVVNMIIMLIGHLKFDMGASNGMTGMIIGSIICVLAALVLQFFLLAVDYSRTEKTQFEDDDYYYYVKAVPKIKVTTPEVSIKRINAQKATKKSNTVKKPTTGKTPQRVSGNGDTTNRPSRSNTAVSGNTTKRTNVRIER